MAKILIIDPENTGLSLAWRCVIAGHEVKWFAKPTKSIDPDIGRGFKGVDRIENWVSFVNWADLIFPTGNGDYMERLEFFRKRGLPIFGPSIASANLEISRKDGMKIMKNAGIEIAPYQTFKDMQEAEDHVAKTKERYVFKTMGDNEDKSLTYVSKSAADMREWMKRMRRTGSEPKGEVMLQTFIKGIEMGVSRWMGSKGFIGPWNESFEYKKLMSKNFGCNTGEMGTIAAFTNDSKLGMETLAKLEQDILRLGHLGDTAIGFIIDEESGKPYPTEFTMRPGWPIFNMMLGSIEGDPIQWMIDGLSGKDTTTFKEDIGCCLVAAQGDFPHTTEIKNEHVGVPIYGVTKGNKRHLHPQAVKIDILEDMDGPKIVKRPVWNTTGDYTLVVTGYSEKSVKQAAERAYKTVDQLHISNMMVRDDVGEDLKEKLPELHKLGYATHFNYD